MPCEIVNNKLWWSWSQVAAACFSDMVTMVDQEKRSRKAVLEWGVRSAEREAFEVGGRILQS